MTDSLVDVFLGHGDDCCAEDPPNYLFNAKGLTRRCFSRATWQCATNSYSAMGTTLYDIQLRMSSHQEARASQRLVGADLTVRESQDVASGTDG